MGHMILILVPIDLPQPEYIIRLVIALHDGGSIIHNHETISLTDEVFPPLAI